MSTRTHPLDTLLRRLAAAAAALALVAASPAFAGGIVVVSGEAGAPYVEAIGGFLEGLAELGVTERVAVYQLPEENDGVAALTADGNGTPADLVVALGSRAAASVISALPATTPVVTGLLLRLDDLPAPNVTGVSLEIPIATQLDWLRRLLPAARSVGVLYDPAVNGPRVEAARRAAAQLGLRLEAVPVPRPVDLPGALEAVARRADVLLGIPDGLVLGPESARSVLLFSLRNRIPFVGLAQAWVKAGALYALEPDYREVGKQCAELAVEVLRGDSPRALAPQSPRRVSVTYNPRTMELLGLELPADMLASARAAD